jgi:hypothetical protein
MESIDNNEIEKNLKRIFGNKTKIKSLEMPNIILDNHFIKLKHGKLEVMHVKKVEKVDIF